MPPSIRPFCLVLAGGQFHYTILNCHPQKDAQARAIKPVLIGMMAIKSVGMWELGWVDTYAARASFPAIGRLASKEISQPMSAYAIVLRSIGTMYLGNLESQFKMSETTS